jgi:ankyrin repeat protein
MKSLKITLAAAMLALLGTPIAAQDLGLGSDSDQFIEAIKKSDGDKAIALVQSHPNIVDTKDSKGDTGLIIAIGRSDANWTGFLLTKGADPNLAGANGDTPLIAAARVGFNDAAGWLLGMGAKVDDTNRMGETALIIAVQRRNTRLVKTLLEHGANPDKPDAAAGYSARDYATRDPRARDILKLIEDKKPEGASASAK